MFYILDSNMNFSHFNLAIELWFPCHPPSSLLFDFSFDIIVIYDTAPLRYTYQIRRVARVLSTEYGSPHICGHRIVENEMISREKMEKTQF